MAMNVKENLKALGIDAVICTNIFTDDYTPTKKRLIDEISNQMLLRVDTDDSIAPIDWKSLKRINFKEYDAVVISDYNKGFLEKEHIQYIIQNHPLTFMDSKKRFGDWAKGITYIKINEKEYDENITPYLDNELFSNIIVTLGGSGAMLMRNFNGRVQTQRFPIEKKHEVRDLSGAGDTFLAAIVAKFLENNDICEAIKFANKCASWVVTQKGVVVVDLNKIEL